MKVNEISSNVSFFLADNSIPLTVFAIAQVVVFLVLTMVYGSGVEAPSGWSCYIAMQAYLADVVNYNFAHLRTPMSD